MFWYAYLCCLLVTLPIMAPEEISFRDTNSSRKKSQETQKRQHDDIQHQKAKKLFEEKPQRENKQTDDINTSHTTTHTPFEDSLKIIFEARKKPSHNKHQSNDPFEQARRILDDVKQSPVPLAEFVKPLRDTYNSNKALSDIYSGEKYENARKQLEQDLKEFDPYLYKKWRDAFYDEPTYRKKNTTNHVARTDKAYFDYLNEHPEYLLNPDNPHEDTPLEIAINTSSPEMAEKIVNIARQHNISSAQLLAPLIERYKVLHNIDPEDAHKYLQSIYDLDIPKLSNAMYRDVSKLQ